MNRAGVWLDFKEANIIKLTFEEPIIEHIESEIEPYHVVGGARSKTPWGPMDNVSESKALERKKQQRRRYYESIIEKVKEVDKLYIFGPAEAKIGLGQAVVESNYPVNVVSMENADSMTLNQKVAKTKAFFSKERFPIG